MKKGTIIIGILLSLVVIIGFYYKQEGKITASEGTEFVLDCREDEAYIEGLYNGNSYEIVEIPTKVTIQTVGYATYVFKITGIKEGAFQSFDKIRKVQIPVSINKIEKNAFSGCVNLTTVEYMGTEEEWDRIVIEEGNKCLDKAAISFQQ